jgi:hypothetical protein
MLGYFQRRRMIRELADQTSIMRTGRTAAEARAASATALARAEEERILVPALLRRGMTAEDAVAYARMGPDERRAWREVNPDRAASDDRRGPAGALRGPVRRWPFRR